MIAVADASPLCYLVLIGEIDLLPQCFRQVLVPHAVITELRHEDAPAAVRAWAANLPSWICPKENPLWAITGLEKLQAGEQAAILLAESMRADIILQVLPGFVEGDSGPVLQSVVPPACYSQ